MPQPTVRPTITLSLLVASLRRRALWLLLAVAAVGMVSFVATLFMPQMYRSDERVGYEEVTSTVAEGLHNVGVLTGYDFGPVRTNTDAFFPPHYQLLIKSPQFMARVMATSVTQSDGLTLTYRDHLVAQRAASWWQRLRLRFQNAAEAEAELLTYAQGHILCAANTMTNLVSISVLDRDPVVAALMADSVRSDIQTFMADYRRSKHEADAALLRPLVASAEVAMNEATDAYDAYVDSHVGQTRTISLLTRERLATEMLARRHEHDVLRAFLRHAEVQQSDPTQVFTPVQGSYVAPLPIGPRRGYIVGTSCLLTLAVGILFAMRRPLWAQLTA